jgi:hypothetical protein
MVKLLIRLLRQIHSIEQQPEGMQQTEQEKETPLKNVFN